MHAGPRCHVRKDHLWPASPSPSLPAQISPVLRTLLIIYSVKANALQHAIGAYLDDPRSPGELIEHRDELLAFDEAIEQLGWTLGARLDPIEIVGERETLSEAVHDTLTAVAETLVERCGSYLHGDYDVADLHHTAADLNTLLELFDATEQATPLWDHRADDPAE